MRDPLDLRRSLFAGDVEARLRQGERPEAIIAQMQARLDDLEALVEDLTAAPPDWHDIPGRLGVHLTPYECKCLAMLLRRQPQVVTRQQLLCAMYQRPGSLDEPDIKIVDVIICKVRRKLKQAREPVQIVTVLGAGYRLETGPVAGAS